MNWDILTQLLVAILVSAVASILVLRCSAYLERLSTIGVVLLSIGLVAIAAALALGPDAVVALLPSEERVARVRSAVVGIATVGSFNIAALSCSAAALIFVSSNTARSDTLRRSLGSMLGVMGVGTVLALASGRIMSGISDFGAMAVLAEIRFPALMLAISVISARQWSDTIVPNWRFFLSMASGAGAFNYSLGFVHGYFDGLLTVLRGV